MASKTDNTLRMYVTIGDFDKLEKAAKHAGGWGKPCSKTSGEPALHFLLKNRNFPEHFYNDNGIVGKAIIDAAEILNHPKRNGNYLIHDIENIHALNAMIRHGADINFRNKLGKTLLHFCAARSSSEKDVVERLLSEQADITSRDNAGRTPVETALVYGNLSFLAAISQHANQTFINALRLLPADFSTFEQPEPGVFIRRGFPRGVVTPKMYLISLLDTDIFLKAEAVKNGLYGEKDKEFALLLEGILSIFGSKEIIDDTVIEFIAKANAFKSYEILRQHDTSEDKTRNDAFFVDTCVSPTTNENTITSLLQHGYDLTKRTDFFPSPLLRLVSSRGWAVKALWLLENIPDIGNARLDNGETLFEHLKKKTSENQPPAIVAKIHSLILSDGNKSLDSRRSNRSV